MYTKPRTLFRRRIKSCGMPRAGDIRPASELAPDAIGFVFARSSPRRLRPEEARLLRHALAPLVDAVALFADNGTDEVRDAIRQVRPTLLQFHGGEEDAFCRSFGLPYIKAIPMGGIPAAPLDLQRRYPAAAGFLFDAHPPGGSGGSGETFDWSLLPRQLNKPVMLAGGLTPGNVCEAILATLPWGVDVSSGIESSPGIKDGDRMRRFVEQVRQADCPLEHSE